MREDVYGHLEGTKFCVEIFGRLYTRPIGFRTCWLLKEEEFEENDIIDELITLALSEYSKLHEVTTEDINNCYWMGNSELLECDIYQWQKVKKEGFSGHIFSTWEWEKLSNPQKKSNAFYIESKHLADIGDHKEATESVRDHFNHWYEMVDGSEDGHEEQRKEIDKAWKESFPWEEDKNE